MDEMRSTGWQREEAEIDGKELEAEEKEAEIDGKELEAAEKEAEKKKDIYGYTHELDKEFEYEGIKYSKIRFDWGKLTGNDGLAIEGEMQALGAPVVIPALSGGFLIRMAARAGGVPADALLAMPMRDYNRIRSEARSFLLKSEW